MTANSIEYRGYTLSAVEHSPGWRVQIFPGRGLLHTQPDYFLAPTKEEAFAEARVAIDYRLSS